MKKSIKKNKIDTVIIPLEFDWDWSADYERQTALELSKKFRVFLYMQNDRAFFLKRSIKYPKINNVTFYQPKYVVPFSFRSDKIKRFNQVLDLLKLKFIFLRNRFFLLWIFSPKYYEFPMLLNNCVSLYDCVDYQWKLDKVEEEIYKENERVLIKNVDYFFVNSKTLFNLHKKHRKADAIVTQGFADNIFQGCKIRKKVGGRKVVGYVGGLNYRLDFSLLLSIVADNSDMQFEFWGPIQKHEMADDKLKTKEYISNLLKMKNIKYDVVNKKDIPKVIANFDVAMIPYRTDLKFNKYCYPMKLFEYFYMGKPVVSTPIEELKRFPKYVKIGKNVKEWKKHISSLLLKPWSNKLQKEQRNLAVENSWKNKVNRISTIIEGSHEI